MPRAFRAHAESVAESALRHGTSGRAGAERRAWAGEGPDRPGVRPARGGRRAEAAGGRGRHLAFVVAAFPVGPGGGSAGNRLEPLS
ncbi:hypothetical protein SUDANB6_02335 [Streptomyces sp. enrichment culture]